MGASFRAAHISALVCMRMTSAVPLQPRILATPSVRGGEALGLVVAHLENVGTAVRIQLGHALEEAHAPGVVPREERR